MAFLDRFCKGLLLIVAVAVAGCSATHAYAQEPPSDNSEFFLKDEAVRGFARIADDGYLEIIQNRALSPNSLTERYAPGSTYFQLFTSALGGLAPGEVKKVPNYSGLAWMEADGTIVVRYVARNGGDAILNPPPSFTYPPSYPAYSELKQMYRVQKPGDGYFIP